MHLGSRPSFLVLNCDPKDLTQRVSVAPSLSVALKSWSSGTRVSPIWAIREFGSTDPVQFDFPERHVLLFLGLVAPAQLSADIAVVNKAEGMTCWVTAGCMNVVIRVGDDTHGQAALKEITVWAKKNKTPLEVWFVRNGLIERQATVSLPIGSDLRPQLDLLAQLVQEPQAQPLKVPIQEYCTLMASALSRSAIVSTYLHSDLLQVADFMSTIIQRHKEGRIGALDVQSRFLSMNAALSRFSAQTFSGIPAISHTECHFWIHSLLGTGSANLAVSKMASHIYSILGAAYIPERIAALRGRTDNVPDLDQLTSDAAFLAGEHLLSVEPSTTEPIAPLVTYFSGRDGFSSHLQTLSAPLTTIAECNSYCSNLLTITHELSHIFVQGVLAHLYPNLDNADELQRAWELTRSESRASNWFEAAQMLLLEGLISMEQEWQGHELPVANITIDVLADILRSWRREAQEIMVHTFDFLYFYGGNTKPYIGGIWHSWSAIPVIADRIPEYVLRTLCAISPRLLKEEPRVRAESAKRELNEVFRELLDGGKLLSNYVQVAQDHLKANWQTDSPRTSIINAYRARLYLVRLVVAFLHSESLAAKFFSEPHAAGGSESGYAKQRLEYDLRPIGSPLLFLREHLKDSPGESESL